MSCKKISLIFTLDTNNNKNIQEEEQHNVELAQQNAEEQLEVVLVMEEEMVKPQLREQSKFHAKRLV